ncbi:MAG: DUF3990 domain-containing protein [Anaeroplasma bactoclasticum]|nr:DUF3990 domain-containing protein [Lachnospiraceae bacterium]MCM1514766.1 DUF3990 domain-containing protein [Anaeroplasma bactoclasticum]MCM1557655.1 DUF3990 domain-containing protein [Anaeroplasma bactoclasticum]
MGKIILFHGTPNEIVSPVFGCGDEKHDYGKGFYLTESAELAKEWAVCRPNDTNGWVHKFELDTEGLRILDFQEKNVLSWLAELMKHRDAADSKRYRMLASHFIEKYGIDTSEYDVIKGWRANASYFYIAKEFVRDNIDIDILEELLSLGGLGIQYCIKSEKAYSKLVEVQDSLLSVDYAEFNGKYNQRDITARKNMRVLVDSDRNKVKNVFSRLLEEWIA